jgi:hypothetical protein
MSVFIPLLLTLEIVPARARACSSRTSPYGTSFTCVNDRMRVDFG